MISGNFFKDFLQFCKYLWQRSAQEDCLPLWATFQTLPDPFRANFPAPADLLSNISKICCKSFKDLKDFLQRFAPFLWLKVHEFCNVCDLKSCFLVFVGGHTGAAHHKSTSMSFHPIVSVGAACKMTTERDKKQCLDRFGGWFTCLEASLYVEAGGPLLCGMSTTFGWCQINPGPSNKAGT